MDCGPTCLQMIARFHGRSYTLPFLREISYISREGVSLQGIMEAADRMQQNYLITAPITGKINLEKIWSENQFVQTGEPLLTIIPAASGGKIIAKAKLPIANSGKVKIGQTVNISLNGYPYQEFGILKAEVAQIALVPQEEFYILELTMPNTLLTTYDKVIPFTQEMQGTADIITEDRRILQRVFDRLWNLLKNT